MNRDGNNESIWQRSAGPATATGAPDHEQLYDAIVVGAGITGITTALLLQQAGKKVLVAESRNIAFGTTGGTTAHINTFFDSSYDEVIGNFGLENAKLFATAAKESLAFIQQQVREHAIDCAFEERTGYLFSLDEKQNDILDKLVDGTKQVGVDIDIVNDSAFPIPYLKVATLPGQAQFNPVAYIEGLTRLFAEAGGVLAENCRVTEAKAEEGFQAVTTSRGEFRARHLVYATHIPPGVNILHFRNAPYRSYAMAVTLKDGAYPQALGYDLEDPYHYYRSQKIGGKEYLIAGGEDHKTGHAENTEQCFRNLEAYLRKYFEIISIDYKWSSQYYVPVDGLPYIGHLPGNSENVFTATGFNGNGMMLGTISGRIISDLILTGESKYRQLFSPSRVKPVAGFKQFVTEAADVVGRLIGDLFKPGKLGSFADLAPGEAKMVRYEGHTLGIYKDEQGGLHAVNSACTHIKCTVGWNSTERSWDCPCHGTRYSMDGELLNGPARKDLERVDLLEKK